VLHGDNGATLKATTVLAMLHWLGVKPSYSRPRVSDDNAFVESLFRTAKYRPQYPEAGLFADLQAARQWASDFMHWYNHEHRHSGIRWRHAGAAPCRTHALYAQDREDNPLRWSGPTRDWSLIKTVTLNPERTEVQNAALTRTALCIPWLLEDATSCLKCTVWLPLPKSSFCLSSLGFADGHGLSQQRL